MKKIFLFSLALCCLLRVPLPGMCAQNAEDINPCELIAAESVFTAFPALKKAVGEKIGPTSVCNYLDKYDIPALVVSVSQAGPNARSALAMLDSGYRIEEIGGLGDEAAIAVQLANPKFGIKEGVAALSVKKKKISLNLSFFRISIQQNTPEFTAVRSLAGEMLKNL